MAGDTYLIPTLQGDQPPYDLQISLDGKVYTLGFRYLDRSERWVYDVRTADGTAIVVGQPVLNAYPLLRRFVDEQLPPGDLRAVATSEPGREANDDELGSRVLLVYQAAEV